MKNLNILILCVALFFSCLSGNANGATKDSVRAFSDLTSNVSSKVESDVPVGTVITWPADMPLEKTEASDGPGIADVWFESYISYEMTDSIAAKYGMSRSKYGYFVYDRVIDCMICDSDEAIVDKDKKTYKGNFKCDMWTYLVGLGDAMMGLTVSSESGVTRYLSGEFGDFYEDNNPTFLEKLGIAGFNQWIVEPSSNTASASFGKDGNYDSGKYLLCDGRDVDKDKYPELYKLMKKLPDYRGVFLRGLDAGKGVDKGRVLNTYQASRVKDSGYKNNFTKRVDFGNDGESYGTAVILLEGALKEGNKLSDFGYTPSLMGWPEYAPADVTCFGESVVDSKKTRFNGTFECELFTPFGDDPLSVYIEGIQLSGNIDDYISGEIEGRKIQFPPREIVNDGPLSGVGFYTKYGIKSEFLWWENPPVEKPNSGVTKNGNKATDKKGEMINLTVGDGNETRPKNVSVRYYIRALP